MISALGNISLSGETYVPKDNSEKTKIGTTITLPKKPDVQEQSPGSETMVLPKKRPPTVGATIILPKGKCVAGNPDNRSSVLILNIAIYKSLN